MVRSHARMRRYALFFIAVTFVHSIGLVTSLHAQIPGDRRIDREFDASRLALYTGAVSDLTTTWSNLAQGGRESNPLLGQNRLRQGIFVVGSTVLADLATRRLYRNGHPTLASVLNFMIGGHHGTAALVNMRR